MSNPLLQNGEKLIPSVTRVFKRDQNLFIYLQAYQPAAQPLVAYVSLYAGPAKAFETAPVAATEGRSDRLKTMPLAFSIPLKELAPGQYDCRVTVLNPEGQKATFWQAPLMLLP